jgi:hypothetical protein
LFSTRLVNSYNSLHVSFYPRFGIGIGTERLFLFGPTGIHNVLHVIIDYFIFMFLHPHYVTGITCEITSCFFLRIIINNKTNLCAEMSNEAADPNALEDYVDSDEEATLPPKDKIDDMLQDEEEEKMEIDPQGAGTGSNANTGSKSATNSTGGTAPDPSLSAQPPAVPTMVPPPVVPVNPPANPVSTVTTVAAAPCAASGAASASAASADDLHLQRQRSSSTTSTGSYGSQSSVKYGCGAGSANLSRAYYNIKAARDSTRTVRIQKGLPGIKVNSIGSFINDDMFSSQCNYRHNYAAKQNISTSFDMKNFYCNTCTGEGHVVLHREGERVAARELAPVAFVLSDQNFAPSLPVEDGGECLKIIRVEDSGLQELVTLFLEATRGFIMPAGSVVVLTSASQLAWVGASTYAREYVAARLRLRAAFRGGIEVVHGVPLLVGGVEDCNGIWALNDLYVWLGHLNTGRDITDTHSTFTDTLTNTTASAALPDSPLASGKTPGSSLTSGKVAASPLVAVTINTTMPADLETKTYAVFGMRHVIENNAKIEKFSVATCNNIIDCLLNDLNKNFMTELGSAAVAEQFAVTADSDDNDNQFSHIKFIFVGGSHAGRLAAAADNAGLETANLLQPGLRVTPENMENLAILLSEELDKEDDLRQIVIFQLYDNNSFFSVLDDGSKSLPAREKDGIYHVPGRLEVADHAIVKNLVNVSVPLLRAARNCEKIILSPMPRYLKKCCSNKQHLTNRKEPGYKQMLDDGLSNLNQSLQELVHGKKIRNFKVLSPLELVGDDSNQENKIKFWDVDPVHLTPAGYSELTRAITEAAVSREYDRQPKEEEPQPAPRVSASMKKNFKRQPWIAADDNTAHRVYQTPHGIAARGGRFGGRVHNFGGRDGPHRGRGAGRSFYRAAGGRGGRQRGWPY